MLQCTNSMRPQFVISFKTYADHPHPPSLTNIVLEYKLPNRKKKVCTVRLWTQPNYPRIRHRTQAQTMTRPVRKLYLMESQVFAFCQKPLCHSIKTSLPYIGKRCRTEYGYSYAAWEAVTICVLTIHRQVSGCQNQHSYVNKAFHAHFQWWNMYNTILW